MQRHRTLIRTLVLALACSSLAVLGSGPAAHAASGIVARPVVTGLNGPAGFTFLPDGRIVYLERGTGEVHIYNPERKKDSRFFTIPGVNGDGERGALGVAAAPGWPTTRTLYVYVTRSSGSGLRNQIVKITREAGHARMRVLMSAPASSDPYHNGGRILFGSDGMLYAIVGDGHDSTNAQDLSGNLRGKILRMTPGGGVPSDNPIAGSRIYAFGIRNSYGFTFDSATHRLWESENGPECNDEMNLIVAGGNFGWGPQENCQGSSPDDTNGSGPAPRIGPKLWFEQTIGITGTAFCHGCGLGNGVEGDLFFGDVNDGILRRIGLNGARDDVVGNPVSVLNSPNDAIYSMETGPDGRIYFSDAQGIYRLATG
jgi:glucose/arabinose dehydrogenase